MRKMGTVLVSLKIVEKRKMLIMKELKILYLYPDMLELYGDFGNIQVLKYRLEKRGFNAIIDTYSIGSPTPDFLSYDLVFAGRRSR